MRNLIDSKTRVVVEHKRINLHKLINYRKQTNLYLVSDRFFDVYR